MLANTGTGLRIISRRHKTVQKNVTLLDLHEHASRGSFSDRRADLVRQSDVVHGCSGLVGYPYGKLYFYISKNSA